MDAAEYKHTVLGLIFLKYISDKFKTVYDSISKEEYADPEDPEEYKAKNAFYDALADNESAIKTLGDVILKQIARELTDLVRANTSIDWTMRSNVQAKLKVMIKRLLRKYGYPPDQEIIQYPIF